MRLFWETTFVLQWLMSLTSWCLNILDNLFCRKSWTVADPFIRMLKQLVCIFADEKYSTRSRKIVLQNNKWSLLIITISCYKIKVFLNLSGYAILAIWRNFMLISIIPSEAGNIVFQYCKLWLLPPIDVFLNLVDWTAVQEEDLFIFIKTFV